MKLDPFFLEKCIKTLEHAYTMLQTSNNEDIAYELYRSAIIKEFEIILEQSGKLLKKILKLYSYSSKAVDILYFKDIYRHAVLHSIMDSQECERWLIYRDHRNNTAHDYGEEFANEILSIIPQFIIDAKRLLESIKIHSANQ